MFSSILAVRFLQFVLAIIELALAASVCHWYLNFWDYFDWPYFPGFSILPYHEFSPSQVNFMIFNGVETLVLVFFLIILWDYYGSEESQTNRTKNLYVLANYSVLAADAITAVLWLAGFAVLASYRSNIGTCDWTVCNNMTGTTVVGAIEMVLFIIATIQSSIKCYKIYTTRTTPPNSEPVQQSGVEMAQKSPTVVVHNAV